MCIFLSEQRNKTIDRLRMSKTNIKYMKMSDNFA